MIKTAKQHLKNSKKNYWAHLIHSLCNAWNLTIVVLSSIIHAFFPMILRQHAARGVVKVYNTMKNHAHLRKMINEENAKNKSK